MSFMADLSAFTNHCEGNIDKALQQTVVLLSQSVILATPVESGRLRSNWLFGKIAPTGTVSTFDPSGAAAIAKIAGQVPSVKAGGSVWLVNNLPYAYRVEYQGWSHTKAPAGMVRVSLANLPAAIESYVQGLR